MEDSLEKRISEFAWHLGQAAGFASFVIENEEAALEFAARGASRKDLCDLLESAKKVAEAFYAEPKPV